MGPEAIRETLTEEGMNPSSIEYALQQLSLSSNINDPLRYARKIAENHKPPARPMGCSACVDGWLRNADGEDPSRFGTQFFPDHPHQDFVRPCLTCRPHYKGGSE